MAGIGRYEIEHELGRGAMGVVYLARDPRLERQVAVKVIRLPPGLSEESRAEFRERFLREARAAAGLTHRSIVTVYEFDDDPEYGAPFLAMEYVPGRSLRQLFDDEAADDVAAELQITRGAAYSAKARVLRKLRQLAAGLVDESVFS